MLTGSISRSIQKREIDFWKQIIGKNVRYRNFARKRIETGIVTSVAWIDKASDVMVRFDNESPPLRTPSVLMTQLEILSDTAESIVWRLENNV